MEVDSTPRELKVGKGEFHCSSRVLKTVVHGAARIINHFYIA